jgi:hypothetical protein
MKSVRFALAMATAAMIGLASTVGYSATSTKATSPAPMPLTEAPTRQAVAGSPIVPVLVTTSYSVSSKLVAVGPGFQPMDSAKTLTCPTGKGVCRIEADQAVQVTGGVGGFNRWAVCTQVDGIFMNRPSCPFLGLINPSSFQSAAFSQQQSAVSEGDHTVRTFIYTDTGAQLGNYSIQYHIYQ